MRNAWKVAAIIEGAVMVACAVAYEPFLRRVRVLARRELLEATREYFEREERADKAARPVVTVRHTIPCDEGTCRFTTYECDGVRLYDDGPNSGISLDGLISGQKYHKPNGGKVTHATNLAGLHRIHTALGEIIKRMDQRAAERAQRRTQHLPAYAMRTRRRHRPNKAIYRNWRRSAAEALERR